MEGVQGLVLIHLAFFEDFPEIEKFSEFEKQCICFQDVNARATLNHAVKVFARILVAATAPEHPARFSMQPNFIGQTFDQILIEGQCVTFDFVPRVYEGFITLIEFLKLKNRILARSDNAIQTAEQE